MVKVQSMAQFESLANDPEPCDLEPSAELAAASGTLRLIAFPAIGSKPRPQAYDVRADWPDTRRVSGFLNVSDGDRPEEIRDEFWWSAVKHSVYLAKQGTRAHCALPPFIKPRPSRQLGPHTADAFFRENPLEISQEG